MQNFNVNFVFVKKNYFMTLLTKSNLKEREREQNLLVFNL